MPSAAHARPVYAQGVPVTGAPAAGAYARSDRTYSRMDARARYFDINRGPLFSLVCRADADRFIYAQDLSPDE
jgi:hypothetical protein